MVTNDTLDLRNFLGISATNECHLFLPSFSGPSKLDSDPKDDIPTGGFRYLGHTFADRDAKAANYVSSILSHVVEVDKVVIEEAGAFFPGKSMGACFLFGSRSNPAVGWITEISVLGKFCHFEFGEKWSIRCRDNREFSLPAPDKLNREEYSKETDYGVVGRFRKPGSDSSVFLIAGLGGRATEGAAYFLAKHWRELARRFPEDFVVVLKFPPPIDPKQGVEVAAFD